MTDVIVIPGSPDVAVTIESGRPVSVEVSQTPAVEVQVGIIGGVGQTGPMGPPSIHYGSVPPDFPFEGLIWVNPDAPGLIAPAYLAGVTVDAGMQPVSPGVKGFRPIVETSVIDGWSIAADAVGDITFEIWCNNLKIGGAVMTAAQFKSESDLGAWTQIEIPAGNFLEFRIISASAGISRVTFALSMRRISWAE